MFGGGAGEAGEGGLANGAPARSEPSSASVTEFDLGHFFDRPWL